MNVYLKTQKWIFGATLLLISSCQNTVKNPTAKHSDSVKTIEQIETKISPADISILIPTQYRKESQGYPENIKDKEWHELYKDKKTGQWLIGKAELKITYGFDECAAEDIMIIKSKNENAVIFFTPFESLNNHPMTILENKSIFPNQILTFNLNENEYKLSPKGNIYSDNGYLIPSNEMEKLTDEELTFNRISSYILDFISTDNITYPLAHIPDMQSVTPTVIWAGDLNNDGLPDMILDLSDFYESQHLFFFLSDKSDKKQPLKKVAELHVVNDC